MDILKSNKTKYYCIALIVLALGVKLILFRYLYVDYLIFLSKWVQYIKDNGYIYSLKDAFHNYTITYIYVLIGIAKLNIYDLYAIKTISVLFEFITAFFVGKIAYMVTKQKNVMWLSMAIILLLPTVLLNSSLQSQCDSIYAAFTLGSMYFLLRQKFIPSMIFLGIAISFKAQTSMILPFYFVYMMRGNIRWYYFAIIPVVYLITILPAWIVGRPLLDLLTIYQSQSKYNNALVLNFPNIYQWVGHFVNSDLYDIIYKIGMGFVATLTIVAGFVLKNKRYHFSIESWIKLAFLSAITCPFFLPGMLERYMYLGDILGVLYILTIRRKIYLPIAIFCISYYSYIRCIYLFGPFGKYTGMFFSSFEWLPWEVVTLIYAIVITLVALDFVKTLKANKLEDEFIPIA